MNAKTTPRPPSHSLSGPPRNLGWPLVSHSDQEVSIYEIWKWHFGMTRAPAEAQPAALVALPLPEAAP